MAHPKQSSKKMPKSFQALKPLEPPPVIRKIKNTIGRKGSAKEHAPKTAGFDLGVIEDITLEYTCSRSYEVARDPAMRKVGVDK